MLSYLCEDQFKFYNLNADFKIYCWIILTLFFSQTLFAFPPKVDIYSSLFNKSTILPLFSHRYGDEYSLRWKKRRERGTRVDIFSLDLVSDLWPQKADSFSKADMNNHCKTNKNTIVESSCICGGLSVWLWYYAQEDVGSNPACDIYPYPIPHFFCLLT